MAFAGKGDQKIVSALPAPGPCEAVGEVAGASLRSGRSSWYVGANASGKVRVFLPSIGRVPAYVRKCDEVAKKGSDGFALV
ncbi:MAG TPA: hypothetical protein VMT29_11215 [Steroidobacteraceae bacterium]|jgi:cyclohexanone monooxygenase|nr:hypothetical protein [Steroidobacteraceae bacterium]